MGQRLISAAVSAAHVTASFSGCSAQGGKPTQKTARVTVDNKTRTSHAVTCSQVTGC